MSVMQLASGRWRVQIRRKKLNVDELYDSEAAAREAEQAALATHAEDGRGLTLRVLWSRYEQSMQFSKKASNTQKTERGRIVPVLDELGHLTLPELEADTGPIYDYMDKRARHVSQRTGRRISDDSIRLEVATLSALVKFAKQRKLVRENFVSNISRPGGEKRKRRVSPLEQGKLKAYTTNSDPAVAQASRFLLLIRHLGCRPGELMGLLADDVNLDNREVLFRDTKNGTDRRVHTTPEALGLLEWQLQAVPDSCPFVFSTWSRYKKAWVVYNYANGVNLLRELGVIAPDMRAHAGRREFVSRAIEAGLPLLTIKKATGHKSTQALEIYDEGLSTAPDVRNQLDAHAERVKAENLIGELRAVGMTDEQLAAFLRRTKQDGTVDPFEEKAKKLGRRS